MIKDFRYALLFTKYAEFDMQNFFFQDDKIDIFFGFLRIISIKRRYIFIRITTTPHYHVPHYPLSGV